MDPQEGVQEVLKKLSNISRKYFSEEVQKTPDFAKLMQMMDALLCQARVQEAKERKLEDVVDAALDVVYAECNMLECYDPMGYLSDYEMEMRACEVGDSFKRLVIPSLTA
ncbi:hypothetical protein GOP47_0000331 [Adiantum capillus-veneris]|uniref:Uncharacterized protein n=1 Tax=Adiantum capillus-veneris TaxID=13818 RepID=A0A9D4VEY4_ADICA|nr:hypothetical protein GOP47_0000331 [Adiantum capillus-veneris]